MFRVIPWGLSILLFLSACDDLTWRAKPAPLSVCGENEQGCDGVWTTTCQDNRWIRTFNCANLDRICDDGSCVVPPDGDESEMDAEREPDSESDVEPDADVDTPDEAELEETSDGDATDQAELEESGDEDTTDQAELEETGDGEGELETDPDAEIIPELDPDPEIEPESDEEAPPAFSCAEGICTDPATGFEWQETPTGGTMTWDDAITHCRNLDLGGTGWRLPNISELRSLIRNCEPIGIDGACGVKDVCSPCGDATACLADSCWTEANCNPSSCADNGGPDGCYWPQQLSGTCSWYGSSSTFDDDLNSVWRVGFYDGHLGGASKVAYSHARCVRDTTPGFVRINAGAFTMGSPEGELGRDTDETQHSVTLTYSFEMQAKEVTQAEFTAFAGTNPSYFGPNAEGPDCGDSCPVERVNWYEAVAYANWLSTQKGLTPCYVLTNCTGTLGGGCAASSGSCSSGTYSCTVSLNGVSKPQDCEGFRLPTEAEWEYAIRAGSTTGFYNGESTDTYDDPKMDLIGWYYPNSDTGSGRMTHPAGGKEANAWGLYDMSGNMEEWVWDWYQAAYESDVGTNPVGPGSGSNRVVRGGSWHGIAQDCRSAGRYRYAPGDRNAYNGFRLVRSLP